ncbi:TonB-dependent receptor [bacterium]|nr:TonB-dependent receptor [bacterium]
MVTFIKIRQRTRGWLLFMILAVFGCAIAAEIRGTVEDAKTSSPLKGADVLIKNTTLGNSTDGEGRFVISGVAEGRCELMVSLLGYQSRTVKLTVGTEGTASVQIKLTPVLLPMEPVWVTGASYRDVLSTPDVQSEALDLSVTEVPRVTMEQQHSKTLVDAMSYMPGAMIENRGRKVKQFLSFRGQRYPYPDYAVDGVWQKEFLELPYFFSSQDIESLEIMRSSAVLLTGLSTMAGVVNVKTREYEESETTARLEYGSYQSMRGLFSHGGKVNALSYAGSLGFFKTKGPANKNAAEQVANAFGKIKWEPNRNFYLQTSAFYLTADRELLLAQPPADSSYWQKVDAYDPVKALLLTLSSRYRMGERASLEVKASYADRKPDYKSYNTLTDQTSRYREPDHELNLTVIQAISLFRDNTVRGGFFYNHWVAPHGKRFYYGKACDTETFAGVLMDEQRLGKLYLDAGLRWEKTHWNRYGAFSINESAKGLTKVTPVVDEWQRPMMMGTLGAAYHFTETISLHGHAAFGRVQPRAGTMTAEMVEPLDEKQIKADVGVQKLSPELGRFSLVYFLTRQDNAIALSGATKTLNGRVLELYLNRDQYQTGLETEWQSAWLWHQIRPFVNCTYVLAKESSKGTMVRNEEYPQWITAAGLLRQGRLLEVNLLGKYLSGFKGSQFLPAGVPPQPLGDFVNVDVIVTWNALPQTRTRLYFELRNLFDKKYATSIGYPDFGRRMYAGITKTW